VTDFDVVIVGARCAGSPLATLLSRSGLRVCVVDRASFPSDTLSTHGIQPCGVQVLDRLGVLDRLLKVAPPVDRGVVALGGTRVVLDRVTERLGAPMMNLRRVTLDAILVEAAAAAGAQIRTGTAVTGLLWDDGRACGVQTAAGDIRGAVVVGADGTGSKVASLVGAREYHVTQPGRFFAWAYFEGVPEASLPGPTTVWLGNPGRHGYLASATDNGLFLAAVTVDQRSRETFVADRDNRYADALREWPELDAVVAQGRRAGPVRVMSRWHGYFRTSAGPGWALLGDAGHFKDPTPGQGISDALRQAEHLAGAITTALDGSGPIDDALQRWWRWRDTDAWDMYWFASDMGAAGPTPRVLQEVRRLLLEQPDGPELLLRVLNHEVPPSAIASVPLFARAVAAALRHPPRAPVLHELKALVAQQAQRRSRAPAHADGTAARRHP
jgi:2-polyprenyl-6-methoxyphenol hydroxylase-like FAD-dependent oxidoreductase